MKSIDKEGSLEQEDQQQILEDVRLVTVRQLLWQKQGWVWRKKRAKQAEMKSGFYLILRNS